MAGRFAGFAGAFAAGFGAGGMVAAFTGLAGAIRGAAFGTGREAVCVAALGAGRGRALAAAFWGIPVGTLRDGVTLLPAAGAFRAVVPAPSTTLAPGLAGLRADLAAPLDFAVGPFRGAIGRAAGRRPSATADRPLRRAAGIAFAVFADPVFRLEFTVLVILAFLAVLIPLTTFDFAVVLAAARDLARSGAAFARVFGATRRERGFSPARGFFAAVVRDGLALERAVACFVDFAAGLAALRAAGAALLAAFLGFTLATTLRIF